MGRMREFQVAAMAFACSFATVAPAHATGPAPLTEPLFAPVTPTGLMVNIAPLVTIPSDHNGPNAPAARIDYVQGLSDNSGRLFVNDTTGFLYQTSIFGAAPTVYLNLKTALPGFNASYFPELNGFDSFAFNPNFNGNPQLPGFGKFYTLSTITHGAAPLSFAGEPPNINDIVLTEWTSTNPAAPTFSGTSREVMRLSGAGLTLGTIAFNPTAAPGSSDYGNLYIGVGQAAYNDPGKSAQDLTSPHGKILRIDPLQSGNLPYSVPFTNPFVTTAGALPEVWAYGLRNPQSFSWDLGGSHAMYINDIGQGFVEEVDVGRPGANYGWPFREGTLATGYAYNTSGGAADENVYPLPSNDLSFNLTYPIAEWSHISGGNPGGAALGSGFLYRGDIAALNGMYVMADIISGKLFYFDPNVLDANGQATVHTLLVGIDGKVVDLEDLYGYNSWLISPRVDARLSEDPAGDLYLALKANGKVFTITADVPEPGSGGLLAVGLIAILGASRRLRSLQPFV